MAKEKRFIILTRGRNQRVRGWRGPEPRGDANADHGERRKTNVTIFEK